MTPKNIVCIWYEGDALDAAQFYAKKFLPAAAAKTNGGLSWQITPCALIAAISDPDPAAAKRAFDAMMEMGKVDIAKTEAARLG